MADLLCVALRCLRRMKSNVLQKLFNALLTDNRAVRKDRPEEDGPYQWKLQRVNQASNAPLRDTLGVAPSRRYRLLAAPWTPIKDLYGMSLQHCLMMYVHAMHLLACYDRADVVRVLPHQKQPR